jgi:peptidyl-prolyl cis-trans isomerase C
MLKTEYELQVKALGEGVTLQQYKLAQILVKDEASAKAVMARLKKESFDKVAKEVSIDESKVRGGDLGWVLPSQILPALANVMVNLNKGSVAVAPIQTSNGWHILKVDDKRAFKVPSFDESKDRVRMGLMQKMRNDYITQLRNDAKINP